MTTEAFELQAVSDEELQAANGGAAYEMAMPAWPLTPNSSVPAAFRGSSSGDAALGLG